MPINDTCTRLLACPAGNLALDLLSTGTGCEASLYALCLSSLRIDISDQCDASVTPLLAAGNYAPGIWSSLPAATYTRLVACPTWARAAVAGGSSATEAQLKAAIQTALEQAVYGSSYPLSLSAVTWAAKGQVTLTYGTCALKYAITQVRCDGAALAA